MSLGVAFAVARYGEALRASVEAFRRYMEACMARDPGAGALGVARQRGAVEVRPSNLALGGVLAAEVLLFETGGAGGRGVLSGNAPSRNGTIAGPHHGPHRRDLPRELAKAAKAPGFGIVAREACDVPGPKGVRQPSTS